MYVEEKISTELKVILMDDNSRTWRDSYWAELIPVEMILADDDFYMWRDNYWDENNCGSRQSCKLLTRV
jgi:hypothetical protein